MRVANADHEAHPWIIARIAPDFELLDAWALPAFGGLEDFDALVEYMMNLDPAASSSTFTRALFSVRFRLGGWFGWDDPAKRRPIPGCTETSLRERLPAELQTAAPDPAAVSPAGFVALYRTDVEAAAEIANGTVHGVLQLAWVDQGDGRYQGRMGVYVKPRGLLGVLYLRLIGPFRHTIVYPGLMRRIERAWQRRGGQPDRTFGRK